METLIALLMLVIGFVGLIVLVTFMRAFVLIKLWGWFMVPCFSLPTLNIPYAIGLSLVMGMFLASAKKTDKESAWSNILTGTLTPLIALFIGWIVHMFV